MASPEEPEGGNPPGPSRIDRILGRFQRMRLSHHPSHEQPPGAQQPHPTAQWQRTSCQRPAAQSKTWYAPQRPPIPSPPQNPSGSPIRMPLPIPASRPPAPPSPPINHPKPIAFPIPQPTGKKPQALPPSPTPLNTNHARPTEARPNNNTMSASHPKPAASKPLSSSNKLNINLPSPIQTPSKPTPNAPNPWHSNPAGKVAIDLTGPTSPNPAKHQSTASKPPTPHRKPSKTEPLAAAKPSTPSKPATQTSRPPKTPTITAATSPSDSPTATPSATGRCAGTTQQGKPCSRRPMKASEGMAERFDELDAILGLSSSAQDDPSPTPHSTVPRFCFQHYHKTRAQEGAWFANSTWVKFSDWIAPGLPEDVKIALKMEMSKVPSEKDGSSTGYLYCHEMRPKAAGVEGGGTYIKVGRSVRPVARLGQWMKQCPSREPIVRGIFPEAPGPAPCYLNGAHSVARDGIRFHRKWERLALLELAGHAALQRPATNRKTVCADCGKTHQELFLLDQGSFERIVKPLILSWQKWCSFAYL